MASAVPPELKPIAGFVQRAGELKGHDEVMRYWCMYHAAQVAMTLSPNQGDARTFMFGLLDQLEEAKEILADNEAVTVDVAGQAYVQNFCDKVFASADTEDRQGKASRATVRNFLAAATFMEVLASFGELDNEQSAKLKYAKWKATDIAKALKEGRTPAPGPADSAALPEPQESTQDHQSEDVINNQKASTSSQNTQATSEEDAQVEAQLLSLGQSPNTANPSTLTNSTDTPNPSNGATLKQSDAENVAAAISADATASPSYPFPTVPLGSVGSSIPSAPTAADLGQAPSQPLPIPDQSSATSADPSAAVFPSAVMPSAPELPVAHETPSAYPATPDAYKPFSPLPASASIPPAPAFEDRSRFPSPIDAPPRSNDGLVTPALSTPAIATLQTPSRQEIFGTSGSSLVPKFQVPALPHSQPIPADYYDAKVVTQAQKHCRFAISALNYDDFAEARKQLRSALQLLDG